MTTDPFLAQFAIVFVLIVGALIGFAITAFFLFQNVMRLTAENAQLIRELAGVLEEIDRLEAELQSVENAQIAP